MAEAVYPFKFPVVSSLPSASAYANRIVVYNNTLYYSSGTSWIPVGSGGGGGGAGVSSLNSFVGDVTISAGDNITVTNSNNDIKVATSSTPTFDKINIRHTSLSSTSTTNTYTTGLPYQDSVITRYSLGNTNAPINESDIADMSLYPYDEPSSDYLYPCPIYSYNCPEFLDLYYYYQFPSTYFIFVSSNGGRTYSKKQLPGSSTIMAVQYKDTYLLRGTVAGSPKISTDLGSTWQDVDTLPSFSNDYKYLVYRSSSTQKLNISNNYGVSYQEKDFTVADFWQSPDGRYILGWRVVSNVLTIYYSMNFGETFSSFTFSSVAVSSVNSVCMDGNRIYFNIYNASLGHVLYVTSDFGNNFTLVNSLLISSMWAFENMIYGYNSSTKKFLISNDYGTSFTEVTIPLPPTLIPNYYGSITAVTLRVYSPYHMVFYVTTNDGYYFYRLRRVIKKSSLRSDSGVSSGSVSIGDTIVLNRLGAYGNASTVLTHKGKRLELESQIGQPLYPLLKDYNLVIPYVYVSTAMTTLTVTANRLYIIPFYVSMICILHGFTMNVTTASAGTHWIGIYGNSNTQDYFFDYSGSLLGSLSFDSGTTGAKNLAFTNPNKIFLYPGKVYYLAYLAGSAATMRAVAGTAVRPLGVTSSLGTSFIIAFYHDSISSLPSSLSSSGRMEIASTSNLPAIACYLDNMTSCKGVTSTILSIT